MRGFGSSRKTEASEPPHPSALRAADLSPPGRGEVAAGRTNSFSRRVRVRVLQKPCPKNPPLKEERRSADRRIRPEAASPRTSLRGLAQTVRRAARALFSFLPRLRGRDWRQRARLSALHHGSRGRYPSTRPRAALPGTTGCKREDPPRHQCSEHLAVRSRAGRDDAQSRPARAVTPRPGYRSRSALGVPSRRRPCERDGS